jgi:hypothetical protein
MSKTHGVAFSGMDLVKVAEIFQMLLVEAKGTR